MTDKQKRAIELLTKAHGEKSVTDEAFVEILEGILEESVQYTPYVPYTHVYPQVTWIGNKDYGVEFKTTCTTGYSKVEE